MNESLIISVKEFRKLTSKETDCFSDEQIQEMILKLDFMAELFIKRLKKEQLPMKQN